MSITNPRGETFTVDEVLTIVRGAFRPFDCRAHSKGLGREIETDLSDGTASFFRQSVTLSLVQTDYNLRTYILGARRTGEDKGAKLDPWP